MCGIFALICKDKRGLYQFDREIFEDGLIADSVRGQDSTGVFGVSMRNELHWVKQGIDAQTFMKSPAYRDWASKIISYRVIVGHNRKATSGAVTSKNAHPFKEGNIILVHNGMLFNSKEVHAEAEVDSEALCHSFATKGATATLKEVFGAFALVWYDIAKREVYLWRNNDRPLSIVELQDKLVVASEVDMAKWILQRDKRHCHIINSGYIKTDTLYTIQLDPYKMVEEPLAKESTNVYQSGWVATNDDWPRRHRHVEPTIPSDMAGDIEAHELSWLEQQAKEIKQGVKSVDDPAKTARAIRDRYPFDSKVLFAYNDARIYLEKPKKFEIQGKIFLPGSPVVNGFIYTKASVDLHTLRTWKEAGKLIGNVGSILGLADGSAAIHLDNDKIEIPEPVKLKWGRTIPLLEWQWICKKFKCSKCNEALDVTQPENVSVNEFRIGEYRVVCSDCIGKALPKLVHERKIAANAPDIVAEIKAMANLQELIEENPANPLKGSTHGS